jgi:hypothetical protein
MQIRSHVITLSPWTCSKCTIPWPMTRPVPLWDERGCRSISTGLHQGGAKTQIQIWQPLWALPLGLTTWMSPKPGSNGIWSHLLLTGNFHVCKSQFSCLFSLCWKSLLRGSSFNSFSALIWGSKYVWLYTTGSWANMRAGMAEKWQKWL